MLNCTGSCLRLFGSDINLYYTYYLREGGWIGSTPRMETVVEEPEEEVKSRAPALEDEVLPDHRCYIQFPLSVLFSTLLYCGEVASALYIFDVYRRNNDIYWMSFTIGFTIVGAILDQFSLLFFHKDWTRYRYLLLTGHILLLGPVVR